jgi:hypothetical protein
LIIASIYFTLPEQIAQAITEYCPIEPIVMASPALLSRLTVIVFFLIVVLWLLELFIS